MEGIELLRKLLNTKLWIFISFTITVSFIVASTAFVNNKLNKQYHSLVKNATKTVNIHTQNPFNFTKKISLSVFDYNAEGFYYSCRSPLVSYKTDAKIKFDNEGVVKTFLFGEHMYHPVQIASFGNIQYSNFIHTNDKSFLEDAIKQAIYFVNASDNDDGFLFYSIDDYIVPGTKDKLKAPWPSAMAQGQALSLLSRIYKNTGEAKYLTACKKILIPITLPVDKGGVKGDFNGHVFYEEYPSKSYPTHVLNGFMFTLIGLYDCYENTRLPLAKTLYEQGIETLKYALPYFDNHNISLYHLGHLNGTGMPVFIDPKYHLIHINQLNFFYGIEKAEIFKYYRDRWSDYVSDAVS